MLRLRWASIVYAIGMHLFLRCCRYKHSKSLNSTVHPNAKVQRKLRYYSNHIYQVFIQFKINVSIVFFIQACKKLKSIKPNL